MTRAHGFQKHAVNQSPPLWWLRWMICLLVITGVCGCASGLLRVPSSGMFGKLPDVKKKKPVSLDDDEEDNDFGNKINTPLLKEYISVQGNNNVVLRGVGIVVGLDGTGDDPPPSALYTAARQEMSRRKIDPQDQKRILQSKDTALVVVTAYLPAMVRKGQQFDVTVAVPPNSDAKSLKGGWLLETRLFEEQNVEGRGSMKGREYGVAYGAILTAPGAEKDPTRVTAEMRRGMIPGGALSSTERDLQIVLMNNKRGFRNSKRIATAVSERFNHYNRFGQRIPLAEAKTDAMMTLKVHPSYRNNFPRYQQVIRNIAFNETEVARRLRMEQLEKDIMKPAGAQAAALQLEAVGTAGIPFLQRALESSDFEVRFHAAQALAYLGDATGVPVLKEAAENKPALRVYALAALSVVDDADAVMTMRELMSAEQLETRYGAFRALKELDPNDPSLHMVNFDKRFQLYLIESAGEPMSHVTRRRTAEVVLFNAKQQLRLPAILNAGRFIRVIGEAGEHTVTITKYSIDKEEPVRRVVDCSLSRIIATCGDLGANYPDIVQLMIEAEQQHNLEGQFGIDRLPQSGRLLVRKDFVDDADSESADSSDADDPDKKSASADDAGDKEDSDDNKPSRLRWFGGKKSSDDDTDESDSNDGPESPAGKAVGTPAMIPNLFDRLDEEEIRRQESDEKLQSLKFEDVTDGNEEDAEKEISDAAAGKESAAPADKKNSGDESDDDSASTSDASDSETVSGEEQSAETDDADSPEETGTSDDEADPSEDADESEAAENPKPSLGQRMRNLFRRPAGEIAADSDEDSDDDEVTDEEMTASEDSEAGEGESVDTEETNAEDGDTEDSTDES